MKPPLVKGGQGRTDTEILDTGEATIWLASTLVQVAAVIAAVWIARATGGPIMAGIVALACVVSGVVGYGIGRIES